MCKCVTISYIVSTLCSKNPPLKGESVRTFFKFTPKYSFEDDGYKIYYSIEKSLVLLNRLIAKLK